MGDIGTSEMKSGAFDKINKLVERTIMLNKELDSLQERARNYLRSPAQAESKSPEHPNVLSGMMSTANQLDCLLTLAIEKVRFLQDNLDL